MNYLELIISLAIILSSILFSINVLSMHFCKVKESIDILERILILKNALKDITENPEIGMVSKFCMIKDNVDLKKIKDILYNKYKRDFHIRIETRNGIIETENIKENRIYLSRICVYNNSPAYLYVGL